jgi:hypothetical protein
MSTNLLRRASERGDRVGLYHKYRGDWYLRVANFG